LNTTSAAEGFVFREPAFRFLHDKVVDIVVGLGVLGGTRGEDLQRTRGRYRTAAVTLATEHGR